MPNPTHMNQGCSSSISRASAVRLSSSRSLLLGFAASCFLGAPVEAQTIENSGFETPTLGANTFTYETQGSGWNISPSAGISANGSGFTGANPSAPEGGQVLFLQGSGSAQRTVTISAAQAGTYRISLKAAQRNGNQQSVRIFLNGTQIDTITPSNQYYVDYTTRDVYLPAGSPTLLLQGTNPAGGDNTAFIDGLSIVRVSDPQNWSDPATWGGTVPAAGAHVDIPAGKIVVLDQNIVADSIIVRGTLRFDPTKDLTVTACSLIAEGKALLATDPKPEGRIEIGTEQTPFTKRVLITLTGGVCTNISNCTCATGGHEMTDGNVISSINGGVLDIHGANNIGPVWTKLNSTIQPGATSITLAEPVAWPVGAQIVITSSTSDPFQTETRTVASVTNGGLTVNLTEGVTNMHAGVQQSHTRTGGGRTWNLDLRAEVGLLTRNITVQGDAASVTTGFGGHVMIMKSGSTVAGATDFVPGGRGYVENAEFYRMGRKGVKGKYPLHFHMLGDEGKGQYFKSNSVHRSYNRAVVIHGTSFTRVENNFCYDHVGHGLMLEDGSERYNRITKNVLALTRRPSASELVTPSDSSASALQFSLPSSFWITNPNNIVDDNVAAGTEGTGIWLLFPRTVVGLSFTDPRFMNMQPSFEPLGSMQRNVTHSSFCGLQTNGGLTQDHSLITNRGTEYAGGMIIRDMTLYANVLGTYGGLTDYTDPSLITHQGFVFSDCHFGLMQANNSLTEDSLGVANTGLGLLSDNIGIVGGTPRSFELSYDGPARVKNCHLVGYDAANASLISNVGASFKSANAPFSGMTYSHTGPPRMTLPDYANNPKENPRTWGMVFRDLDGSTTGQANTSIITNHSFLRTPGDYQPPNWTHAYRSIRKFASSALSCNAPYSVYVPMTVTREKAGEAPVSFYYSLDYNVQVQLPLIVNEDYLYTYQLEEAPAASQPMYFGIGNVDPGDFVRLRIKDFGKVPGMSLDSGTRVSSRAAVDSATSSAYFADTITGDLWVKWFSQPTADAHGKTAFRVSYPASYTPSVFDTDGDGMSDALERNPLANRNPYDVGDLAFNFDTDNDFEGWNLEGMEAYVVAGGNQISRTAGSGSLTRNGLAIDGSLVNSLFVRYQSEASGTLRLYWATSESNFLSEARAINATVGYAAGSGFITTSFDFSGHPEWAGKTITSIRIDTRGAAGTHTWIDYIRSGSPIAGPLFVGGGSDPNLTTGSNWVNGIPAGNLDRLVFGSAVTDGILNLDNSNERGGITLTSGLRRDITINGPQALNMTGATSGGIDMSSAGANLTINSPYWMGGNQNWNVGAGRTLTVNGGLGSGNFSLAKNGAGLAVLTGTNTYTGSTTINAGTLHISTLAAISSSSKIIVNSGGQIHFDPGTRFGTITAPIELNGVGYGDGALHTYVENGNLSFTGPITLLGSSMIQPFAGNSTLYFTNAIGGNGNLTLRGTGASPSHKNHIVLSGVSNFSGDLIIGNYASSAQVTLSGGDNRLPTTSVVRIGAGQWTQDGGPTPANSSALDLNGNNQTIAGLSDSGSLVGARSVVNTNGTPATLTLNTPAYQWFSGTIGGTDINGTAGNNLALVKSGFGTQILAGDLTYVGNTTINGGTLKLVDKAPNSTGIIAIASGAAFDLNVSTTPVVLDNANIAFGKVGGTTINGTGTFIKSGAGVLALDGQFGNHAVTFNMTGGMIDIQGGTLRNGGWNGGIWTTNKASMNIASGARFDIWSGQSVTVDALTGGGLVDSSTYGGSQTLTVGINNGSGTFSGTFQNTTGNLGLIKAGTGTQTLTGLNTYTGNTVVNQGILSLQNASIHDASSVTIAPGAKMDLNFTGNDIVASLTLGGVIQPNGIYGSSNSPATHKNDTYFSGTGTVNVGPVNTAPVANAQSRMTLEDTAVPITLSATDAEGNALTYSVLTQPANGTLSGTAPNLTYTPAGNYNGVDGFTFKANDGALDSATATVSITVTAVNDAPVFTANPIAAGGASESVAYTGNTVAGRAADSDFGDTISYSKVSGPAWLAVASNGSLTGTPPSGSAGLNSFVVRATDSASATADATLQITVTVLPLPWAATDIGTGMLAGSTTHNAGTFTLAGSGVIGGTSDKLRFSYQTLTGDGEIIARISVLQDTGTSSRVGVMIRDTLAGNSKQIFMGMTGTNAYRWLRRTTTGGATTTGKSGTGTVPNTWVRLVRSGTTITAYKSANGTTWTLVGSTSSTTFATNCYIGLAVSSGSNTTLNTSQFTNLSVTP